MGSWLGIQRSLVQFPAESSERPSHEMEIKPHDDDDDDDDDKEHPHKVHYIRNVVLVM